MTESRCTCGQGSSSVPPCGKDRICIDTMRIMDSCRDRDCYEDARVYLTPFGQEIVEHTASVRATGAEIIGTYIGVDPIPFNRGFYQLNIRFYVRVRCEACIGIGRSQEFDGLSVLEKKVVLYGGDGKASIFRSIPGTGFCDFPGEGSASTNLPVGIVETVDPVVLGMRVVTECCHCKHTCDLTSDVPDRIGSLFNGGLTNPGGNAFLACSLGIFSVVRIERPAQYVITANDYAVPDKECLQNDDSNPCSLFHSMAFPTNAFTPDACPGRRE